MSRKCSVPRLCVRGAYAMVFLAAWSASALSARAQLVDAAPEEISEIGIDEKLDSPLPLDLRFRDDRGRTIYLGSLFSGGRPVLLSLNYSDCPMLCSLQLNGLVDGLRGISLTPGTDFEIVSVSIDPSEQPERARLTKQKYVGAYGRPGTAAGWHFLVGGADSIRDLADAVGFRYKYVPERKEFAHAAALMLCTPDGRISRYLYGVQFPPQTLKLSLIEAGEGKIGTTLDRVILFCFHYDAESGRYGPVARRIMRLGAGLTLCVLLVGLVPFWIRRSGRGGEDKNSATAPAQDPAAAEDPPAQQPPEQGQPGKGGGPAALLALPFAQAGSGDFFFPVQGSSGAGTVDEIFYFIFWICFFFFCLIVGLMTYFVLRYRRRPGVEVEKSTSHSNLLEITWSTIPTLIVGVIFLWGFFGYMDMRTPPDDAYEIRVVAKKWSWSFIYPNGHMEPNLHVPVDRPVLLVMSSDDVIHSLFVPAFRIKMDVVPGRYNKLWFDARRVGEYTLFCAEYCGQQHSKMLAKVVVHPAGEFESWLADAANFLEKMTPAEGGQVLYTRRGCSQCHSIDGSAKVGPTFKGAFGTEQALADGTPVVVDENYIRRSILEPQAQVRAGYKPQMPTYAGQIRDEEIDALIAYIKSLK